MFRRRRIERMEEGKLKKLAINGAVYEQGIKSFQKGQVSGLSIMTTDAGKCVTAYVQDHEIYKVQVILNLAETSINKYSCQCGESFAYEGMCRHAIATLMQKENMQIMPIYGEGIKPLTSSTDEENVLIESLVHHYAHTQYAMLPSKRDNVPLQIIPTFHYLSKTDPEGIEAVSLSLKIGEDKLYEVQDLMKLGRDFREKRSSLYGSGQWIQCDIERISPSERALINLLIERSQFETNDPVQSSTHAADTLILSEATFTTFFNKYKEWAGSKEWLENSPHISFVLVTSQGHFTLKLKDEEMLKLKSLYGGNYLWNEQCVFRTSLSFRRKIWPIYKAIQESKDQCLVFSKEEMPKIKRYILDTMEDYVEIEGDLTQLEAYTLPELGAELRFDLIKGNTLTAQVTYHYGEEAYEPAKDQKAPDGIRDILKEEHIQGLLSYYGFKPGKDRYSLTDEESLYHVISEGIEKFTAVGDVYVSDAIKKTKVHGAKTMSVGIKLSQDWLNIDLSCLGIPKNELGKLLEAYDAKRKYYRIKSGDFVDLSGEGIKDLDQLAKGLNLTDKDFKRDEIQVQKYRALYLDRLLKKEKTLKSHKDIAYRKLITDFEDMEEKERLVPSSIQAELRHYQLEGYKWMSMLGEYHFGGILADDMGLGKTLQMITVLCAEKGQGTSLIVCPTSLVFNWLSECEKFAPDLKVMAITGNQSQREEKIKKVADYDVVITSYDLLKRDFEQYQKDTFYYCVIDEAQYIKNSQTLNAKAVKEIKSMKRMALTGTPIENRLAELWSIFDFIMPGYLFSEAQFRKQIEIPIVKDEDEEVLERLKSMIAPFILRRLKTEVLEELPEKTETTIYAPLTSEQEKVYLSYALRAKEELLAQIQAEGIEKSQIKMLALLTRLRQICCHPSLFVEGYEGESGKLDTCMELIENTVASGHKILLFSQFTTMLDLLASRMQKLGISFSLLKGNVKAEKRRDLVEAFNEGDTQVFLISLKAGGVGLNLTGADVVIHYDPWWNLAAQNQATDRAYRIGQHNNVQVFKLITQNTIEEKIKELQDKKQDLTESVLSGEQTMISQLSKEEILSLFEASYN